MNKIKLLLAAMLLGAFGARADSDSITVLRPVLAAYTVESGTSHIADTYLSPIKYSGWSLALRYERMQAMRFDPERWVMRLQGAARAERSRNLVKNYSLWYWGLDFGWAMMRRYSVTPQLTLAIGGDITAKLGCLYLSRNDNNPASAKAAIMLGATGYAAYSARIGRLPVTFSWSPSLPVTGAFFSPDYGELYYEIYLGNHTGLAHWGWWGNYFRLDNQICADLHLGATCLRLGYRGSIESTKVNGLVSRHFTHCAVIGISGEWISLNPRTPVSKNAKIISTLFENRWK